MLALGELCSAAYEDAVEDDGRWVGGPPVDQVQFRVDLRLRVLNQVIALDELRADARFRSAEVIRAPRVSSPIALAPSEWAAVLDRSSTRSRRTRSIDACPGRQRGIFLSA